MNMLVISAHPDDETLGCGGTLLKHHAAGDKLFWLIVTKAYKPKWSDQIIKKKAEEVSRVARAYRMKLTRNLSLPASEVDKLPQAELVDSIRSFINKVNPEIIYLVHEGDIHGDHRTVFHATVSALKSFNMSKSSVRAMLSYETLSSTEAVPLQIYQPFVPTVFVDISPYLEKKIKIMELYKSERQPNPLPRSPAAIRSLAGYRGATVGVKYAEAFMLIRELR